MLRLNEVKLPLDHSEEELHVAAAERLSVNLEDILRCEVFRRAVDARKRSAIQLTYTLDVEVKDEQEVLTGNEKLKQSGRIAISPERLIASSLMPTESTQRPVVIGTGPCGLFAGLLLAQMGFKPIIRNKEKSFGNEPGYMGLLAQLRLQTKFQRSIRGRRSRNLFRWQAIQPNQGQASPLEKSSDRIRKSRSP